MEEYIDREGEFKTIQEKSVSCNPSFSTILKLQRNSKIRKTVDDFDKSNTSINIPKLIILLI